MISVSNGTLKGKKTKTSHFRQALSLSAFQFRSPYWSHETWNWYFKMGNSHTLFFLISLPLSPYEYSSPALFSFLLCFAFKQSWNVRRPPSILIESTVMDELKQLPRDGWFNREHKNSSVSGLLRTTALDSLINSYILLSDRVQLSSADLWLILHY